MYKSYVVTIQMSGDEYAILHEAISKVLASLKQAGYVKSVKLKEDEVELLQELISNETEALTE